MGTRRIFVVAIGAGHVAGATFARKAGRLVLERFALESHSPEPLPKGGWPATVAQSLGALAGRCDRGGAWAIVLPGHLVLTKFIKTPAIAQEKRNRSLAFEAAEHIPLPLEQVAWGHRILGEDELDWEVLLVATKRDAVQSLCDAADSAGLRCEHAVPGSVALHEAFRFNYPEVREPTLVANIGARTTQLLFVAGERFHLRTVELGGNAISEAVAQELGIDFPAAEALKLQVLGGDCELAAQSPSRIAVQNATAGFCARLQLEIRRTAAHWHRQSGAPAAVALYLAGGGSLVPGLAETLADKLQLRVEPYESRRNLEISEPALTAYAIAATHTLAELVGTAAWFLAKSEPEMNLLPPDLTRAIAARKRQPRWLAAAMVVAGALLFPIAYYHERTTAAVAAASEIERQIAPRRLRQAENEDHLRQIDAAKKRIAALGVAHDVRASWITFLAELQARLTAVENVWLDQLKMDELESGAEAGAGDRGPGKLFLSGRLLDVDNPQAKVSPQSFDRVKQLLHQMSESPFVAAVTGERFDNSQDGLLRFEVTLILNPATPL